MDEVDSVSQDSGLTRVHFNLRNSLNSFIKSSSRPLGWVGSRLVGSSWGVLAFGRVLVFLVICFRKRGGV